MALAGQIWFVSDQRKLFGDFDNSSARFSPDNARFILKILRKNADRVGKVFWEYFFMVRRALANIDLL